VRQLNDSQKDAAIVRAIIDMAHTLGLEVMAEGVETVAQRDYLNSQGCTLYQGFLFSRPAPVQLLELHRRGVM
jgi:EAL domain-containing protein (putative c-di-GMP-specific phosphodiesterase class I)